MPLVDEYITTAHKMGVNLIDYTTGSDVMGIALEEETCRSEVESLSGATYFLNLVRQSKVVLFI